jgi:hypothetical protein
LTDQAIPGDAPSGSAAPEREPALRNVVIHLNNEQPVVADLFELPSSRDVAVLCTNLRTPDGKRPIFIDQTDSIFLLPLAHIRFIEMPRAADRDSAGRDGGPAGRGRQRTASSGPVPEADLEIDEDFLRRIRDA